MKYPSLLILFFCFFSIHSNAESTAACQEHISPLGAKYHIVEEQKTALHQKAQQRSREFILWRGDNDVAHEYLDRKITLIWHKTANGRLKALQSFDADKRTIEYEPVGVKETHKGETWAQYFQLFTPEIIAGMTVKSERGSGCDREIVYTEKDTEFSRELVWLPERQLARAYHAEGAQGTVSWTLVDLVEDSQAIQRTFALRREYEATDYADIGDHESDPFLRKMINLGFIAHSEGNFYDSDGNPLPGGHSHH